jgi:hypothetical protein
MMPMKYFIIKVWKGYQQVKHKKQMAGLSRKTLYSAWFDENHSLVITNHIICQVTFLPWEGHEARGSKLMESLNKKM